MKILRTVIRHKKLGLVLADYSLAEIGGGVAGVKVFPFDENGIVKGQICPDCPTFENLMEIGKILLDKVK